MTKKWVEHSGIATTMKTLQLLSIRLARIHAAQQIIRSTTIVKAFVPSEEPNG